MEIYVRRRNVFQSQSPQAQHAVFSAGYQAAAEYIARECGLTDITYCLPVLSRNWEVLGWLFR